MGRPILAFGEGKEGMASWRVVVKKRKKYERKEKNGDILVYRFNSIFWSFIYIYSLDAYTSWLHEIANLGINRKPST